MLEESNLVDIEQAQKDHRELLAEIKKDQSSFTANLEQGELVDCLDKKKIWRISQIESKQEKDKELVLNFLGWESNWNEVVPVNSGRIKPLRSETPTDTFSTKGAYEKPPPLLAEAKRYAQRMLEADYIKHAQTKEINVVLRSIFPALFVEIPKISYRLDDPDIQTIDLVYAAFVKVFMELIQSLDSCLFEFGVLYSKEKLVYLRHKPSAICLAVIDFANIFEIFIGLKDKRHRYNTIYSYVQTQFNSSLPTIIATDKSKESSARIANVINDLASKGIIELVLSIITWERKCKIKEEVGTIHAHPMVVHALVKVLYSICTRCEPNFCNQIASRTVDALNQYFFNFSPNFDTHLYEIDKISIVFRAYTIFVQQKVPVQLQSQLKLFDQDEASIVFYLKYLSCPIFERKYSAISALNARIDEFKKAADKDKDRYRTIMMRHNIVDTLYISGYQPEIARKSDEIFAFVAQKMNITSINKLLISAFQQSSEKGGVISYCLRKSLQSLDIELIKGVLETLASEAIPIDKLEPETIQLIIEVIKQGGEKTNKFYFLKNSKEGTKIVEDSLNLLWNCLDSKNNLQASTMNNVMEALQDNINKSKGGKQRMIEMCILKLKEKRCLTQYIILLKSLLDSLESRGNFMMGNEYDKLMEKIYTFGSQPLATAALNEFIDSTRRTPAEEEAAFNEERVNFSRIQLILLLIFKGKQKSDTLQVFKRLISFLLATADQTKNLYRFNSYLIQSDIIPQENIDIFFSVLNDRDAIEDRFINENIYKLYETLFLRSNFRSGALEYSNPQKRNLINITRQDKFVMLNLLWSFCLRRNLQGSVRDHFYKLLVECYFRTSRKYESTEAQRAWSAFTNDVTDQMNAIRQLSNPVTKASCLSHMAGIWIKVIEISGGPLYINSTVPSPENLLVFVNYNPPSIQLPLAANCSLAMLKNTIIENQNMQEVEFSLYFNGRPITNEDLETASLENAAESYAKNVQKKREGCDFEIEVVLMKDDRIATAYSLRKKVTSGISNNEYFNDYFSSIDLDTEGMIFKLLSMISNNKSARKDVLSVVEPGRSLGSLIDLEKPRTLLYFLSVLYKILQTKKELEFTNKLIASGQLDDLLKIVIQMSKIETKNFETVSAVIKAVFPVINFFLADYPEGGFKMPQAISAQYFESVVSLLQYLFEVQPITTSSDELDKVTICTLSHFETLILKSNCLAQKPNVNWTELFILALVTTSNESMKAHFSRIFEETIMKPQITESVFMEILTPLYKSALDRACQQVTQARHYFNLGSNILRNCPDEAKRAMLISFVSFELVWDKLLPTLLSSMDELLMVSMLKFLAATLQGKSSLTDWVSQNKDYLIQLTSRCLIDKSGKQGSKPICHSTSSRSAFFSFIKAVSSIEESIRKDIYSYFLNIINKGKWRRKLYKDWNIEIAQQQETKSTPYIGLVNLGSTCYMNSIFQQIFAVTEFRNFLIDTEVDYGDDIESNPIFQFQIVMKGLRDAVRQTYNPKNFCRVFTNFDGTPINVTEQMDADEFFNNLMDKLEGELKKNNQDGVIKKTFGGKLVKEIISSDCEHKSTVISDFLTLSIDVKGITSITQSLEKLVAGEILDGDNKYNCETCQKKVKALMRESLYTLPNRLVIVLKRFEFKYETMTKQKLNSYCEFPDFLDMKKFSNEYLTENPEHRHPDNYFEYNLKGITIHRGTAESGHYWSLIKDNSNKWIEYNDIHIREFNAEHIPDIAYGHDSEDGMAGRQTRGTNAYMLFYERKSNFDVTGDHEVTTLLDGVKATLNTHQQYTSDKIMSENFEYYLKRVFFDNTYADFIIDKVRATGAAQLSTKENEVILRLAFSTFFMLLMRKKLKDRIPQMYKTLVSVLQESTEIAHWFILNVSNEEFFLEFFIDCLILDMKYFVYGLMAHAVDTVMKACGPSSPKIGTNPLTNGISQKIKEPHNTVGNHLDLNSLIVPSNVSTQNATEATTQQADSKSQIDNEPTDDSTIAGEKEPATKPSSDKEINLLTELGDHNPFAAIHESNDPQDKELSPEHKSHPQVEQKTPQDTTTVEKSEQAQANSEPELATTLERKQSVDHTLEVIDSVVNLAVICLTIMKKYQDKEKFLGQIFRLVNHMTKHQKINERLEELNATEHLLYLMRFPAAALHDSLSEEVKPVYYESIFKGYVREEGQDAKVMSIEDRNWELKGEAKAKQDFKISYSYLVSAFCRQVLVNPESHRETLKAIVAQRLWISLLDYSTSAEAREWVCKLIHECTKDDINQFSETLKIIEERLIQQSTNSHTLKGGLFVLKYFVKAAENDNPISKKKAIKVLNLMVILLDQVKGIHSDYVLSYLFRMMKCNSMIFEKFCTEGKACFPEIQKKINEFANDIVKEYNKVSHQQGQAQGQNREVERLALSNKKRRQTQLMLLQEKNYQAFKENIFYDSDEEFIVGPNTEEIDMKENANFWRRRTVRNNLGVMYEVGIQGESAKTWVRDDVVSAAPANTATIEYQFKLDGI